MKRSLKRVGTYCRMIRGRRLQYVTVHDYLGATVAIKDADAWAHWYWAIRENR